MCCLYNNAISQTPEKMCASLKKSSLDHQNINNYRPISNLPFLAKVFEKVVASRLRSYLTANGLFEPFQSVFCPSHSTETAVIQWSMTSSCLWISRFINIVILLDLSSAFDCLWWYSPPSPFWNYHHWFRSFLAHFSPQQQKVFYYYARVQIRLCSSLTHGVPQGSVSGPFLFIIDIDITLI